MDIINEDQNFKAYFVDIQLILKSGHCNIA